MTPIPLPRLEDLIVRPLTREELVERYGEHGHEIQAGAKLVTGEWFLVEADGTCSVPDDQQALVNSLTDHLLSIEPKQRAEAA